METSKIVTIVLVLMITYALLGTAQRFVFAYLPYGLWRCVSTSSTTRAGVDNVWEQKKLEARKLLGIAAESPASGEPP
jgi:hypothetical protein